jgi:hypothetical protein
VILSGPPLASSHALLITGAMYNVETGAVEFFG